MKNEIEELIRKGHLSQYKKYGHDQAQRNYRPQHKPDNKAPTSPSYSPERKRQNKVKEIVQGEGTIDVVEVIMGGFARGGLSNNTRKRHL